MLGHVDGNGEANALRRLNDGRVDANNLPLAVYKRPAAVAGIQGSIRLDHVVHKMARDTA